MIWQIVLVTFSPYRYGVAPQKSGSIVSPQPRTSSQWTDVFTNMPLIFLNVLHISCFYIILCIFFSSPFPLFPPPPILSAKKKKVKPPRMLVTADGGPWTWMNPSKWDQLETWRRKHGGLVISWLQGHVCSGIWPLWINQKNLMRMSFCAYLKAEWHYVFKYIMLHSTLSAYKKWSRHKEILVSPETWLWLTFSRKISSAPLLCFLVF